MVEPAEPRYRAFISYSKRDQKYAKRLHSALETYRVPKGIDAPVQQSRRLGRFFRDDDEMGASVDLGGALRDAIDNSENLIVICSPHAARSKWVNEEIRHFRSSGRGDRIFAVVVDGIPNSGDAETNCFPPALVAEHTEPLAIDLRKESFQRVRIRLVAGLLRISFDSLWQREKRRTIRRRAIAAVVSMALLSIIVVLGLNWRQASKQSEAQRIAETLVTVRDDLASERVKAALTQLQSLTKEGHQGPVEEVLKTTLSWVSTPAELLKEIKPPAFVSDGAQLFFLSSDGGRHPLQIHQPYRRVLSSDRRWLLLLGADEAVVLSVADGREIARTSSNQIEWFGEAFETANGLLILTGRYSGGSNSSFRESFLVFAPQRQSLTVFSKHWDGPAAEQSQYRFIQPLYISKDCRSFGVVSESVTFENSETAPTPGDMFFISADADGLKPAPASDSLTDWSATQVFVNESDQLGLGRYKAGDQTPSDMGCKSPASDSARRNSEQILTGPVRPVGVETFWESERRWKIIGDVEPASPYQLRDREAATDNLCGDESNCRIQDPPTDMLSFGAPDATSVTAPRGVPKTDQTFDRVDGEFVYAYSDQGSGGFLSAWCRKLNGKPVCLFEPSGAEFRDELTDFELRSPLGRFVFYPQGAYEGFQLYDLLTMRNVTPKGPELVASTHWADFSADDKRLFVTMNGRLLVFEPGADGPWQLVSDGAPVQVPALSGAKDEKVAGLLVLDDNSLLAVRSSGAISRFGWRNGQESWGRTIGNIGEIVRVVPSRNRRFVLLVGRSGGRLLDTQDGLVLSGVLVPPAAMDGSMEILESLSQAFVSDTGVIEVSAGEKRYSREPITFTGDMQGRLNEILGTGPGKSD